MFSFSSSSHEERYVALYDICSASIGVAVVLLRGETTELLWHKRAEFGYQSSLDYNRYVRTMYATLLEMGMKMTSDGFKVAAQKHPSFSAHALEVVCVLGQPWFLGAVATEVQSKEKTFSVTQALLDELEQAGLSKVLAKQESVSWQEVLGTAQVLEARAELVRLEGYPVHNYLRRSAKELSVQFYYGLVSKSVQEHVDEVLKRVLPNHEIVFLTATHAFSSMQTQSALDTEQRCILLEITGEITSVSIVSKGVCMGVATLPLGTNHVLKAVAPNAVSTEEASGQLEVLRKKHSKSEFEALPPELREALGAWKENVVQSITSLTQGVTPPVHVFVVVDTAWYQFYKISIEKPWGMPGVRVSQENIVHEIAQQEAVSEYPEAVSVQDTRLSLLTRLLPSCTQEKGMWYTEI